MTFQSILFLHRWLGVALCILFLLWFSSGIVMMYRDFPGVSERDRLDRAPVLDPSSIRISPESAFAASGLERTPAQVRLDSFDGRPVYRFRARRVERVVYADSGELRTLITKQMIDRVAADWARRPVSAARVEAVKEADQWTVQGPLRSLRPLWKYSWPGGDQVYVAGTSGEVVQFTTRQSRMWAWLGPIPHWLYFTPLRKRQQLWSRIVIWTSGAATFSALLGLVIGVWMYPPNKRYRGWKRWHAAIGLLFGVLAVTWAFSGMLSMDPFPAKPAAAEAGASDAAHALRGAVRLAAFDAKSPAQAIAQLNMPVKELELIVFDAQPFYLATVASLETRIVPVNGEPSDGFGAIRIADALRRAFRDSASGIAEQRVIPEYDAYYLDRRGQLPLPVVLIRMNDAARTRYYIDPKTARIAGTYSSAHWTERWLYHALHSWDFPWLYKHRPLWDIAVIAFLLGGNALCATALVLAWRVVKRRAPSP